MPDPALLTNQGAKMNPPIQHPRLQTVTFILTTTTTPPIMPGVKQYQDDQIQHILVERTKGINYQDILKDCKRLWPKQKWSEKGVKYVFQKYKNDPT